MSQVRSRQDINADTFALDDAIGAGNLQKVLHYIPLADPTYLPRGLWWASACGFIEAVTALISVCNPQDYSMALVEALLNKNCDVVELLCPITNLDETILHLQAHGGNLQKDIAFLEEYKAQEQHKRLSAEITEEHTDRTKKM
jgi:hypothetical protein